MKTTHLLITRAATLLCLPACATKREVPFRTSPVAPFTNKIARFDYSTYERIPNTPTSAAYRAVLKAFPYTKAAPKKRDTAPALLAAKKSPPRHLAASRQKHAKSKAAG